MHITLLLVNIRLNYTISIMKKNVSAIIMYANVYIETQGVN